MSYVFLEDCEGYQEPDNVETSEREEPIYKGDFIGLQSDIVGKFLNAPLSALVGEYIDKIISFPKGYPKNYSKEKKFYEKEFNIEMLCCLIFKECCNYETRRGIMKIENGDYIVFSTPDYSYDLKEDGVCLIDVFEDAANAFSFFNSEYDISNSVLFSEFYF